MTYLWEHLQYICDTLPPGLPEDDKVFVFTIVQDLENKQNVSTDELEDALVRIGKRIWPYKKAYLELQAIIREEIAHDAFLKQLSAAAKKAYTSYCDNGGCYTDIHHGSGLHTFPKETRDEVKEVVMATEQHVDQYIRQAIHSTHKRTYEQLVHDFKDTYTEIDSILNQMIQYAAHIDDHQQRSEVVALIEHIEHGLLFLVKETKLQEIKQIWTHIAEQSLARQQFLSARV